MQQAGSTFTCSKSIWINYEVSGTGPHIVLFLHGFGAALTTWDDIRPLFPPEKYRLYFLDLLGFGLSATPCEDTYHLHDQAAIIARFITDHDLRNVTLVGHSLGGGVALILAQTSMLPAGRISRLVLIDCACYPQRLPRFFRLLKYPVINRLLITLVPASFIVRSTLNTVYYAPGTITPDRITRYLACFSRRGNATSLIRTVHALKPASFTQVVKGYPFISVPTLIIWGEMDRVVRLEHGQRLAREIPGARLEIVYSCGHNPHEECPDQVFSMIEQFMQMPAN